MQIVVAVILVVFALSAFAYVGGWLFPKRPTRPVETLDEHRDEGAAAPRQEAA